MGDHVTLNMEDHVTLTAAFYGRSCDLKYNHLWEIMWLLATPTTPNLLTPPSSFPCSGYDFGYLLRVLTCQKLPEDENEFFELMSLYFPKVYDVKYLMKSTKSLKGGLQEVADSLEVRDILFLNVVITCWLPSAGVCSFV